ncbi:MAG: thrombospondin type 3 repeat-containing protein, partial [Planctomycetota bacterium]
SSAGTYYVWVRSTPTVDSATAIQDFKSAIPTSADEVRDDKWSTALTVPVCDARQVNLACPASTCPGNTLNVPIELEAQGNENALGFSLTYTPTVLTYTQATLGGDAGSATLNLNTSQTSSGHLGIALALPSGVSFSPGTREVVIVTFSVNLATPVPSTTQICFGDQPIPREVVDTTANPLLVTWGACCTINITTCCTGYEGDVAPRPNGSGSVTIADWVQCGRFAAGLDTAASGCEFQGADCAPRPCGTGTLSIADWVQCGRYAAGLDPLTARCGPTSPTFEGAFEVLAGGDDRDGRVVRAVDTTLVSNTDGCVDIELDAQGDENALGFSLSFDTGLLTFTQATLGSGASGATLIVNDSQAASGRVGLALALPAGQTFPAGTRNIADVCFHAGTVGSTVTTAVDFGDQPIAREIVDPQVYILTATWDNAVVTIVPCATQYHLSASVIGGHGTVEPTDEDYCAGSVVTLTATPDPGYGVAAWTGTDDDSSTANTNTVTMNGNKNVTVEFEPDSSERAVEVVDKTIDSGQNGCVDIALHAQGDENALGFSLDFDTTRLTFTEATLGGDAAGATMNVNDSLTTNGHVGVALALPAGQTFPASTLTIVHVCFDAATVSATVTTALDFGDDPIDREIVDASANLLQGDWTNGTVTIRVSGGGGGGGGDGAVDQDGDGVQDSLDRCAQTPVGADVDSNGCSCSQRDGDNDGVNDCNDDCPNTPAGADVDSNGCAASERDTDGDGVNDSNDRCADTPATEPADANGCSCSQLDTDSDGANNCVDACPSDPSKTAPGACGCDNPDTDGDGDGVADCEDNCPVDPNPGQEDFNGNGAGDVCDDEPPPGTCLPDAECRVDGDCGDEDPCTTDRCQECACQYADVVCPTGETCDPATGECVECIGDDDCPDDGLFCNGAETCVEGQCQHSGSPCDTDEACNEARDLCLSTDGDGEPCNGPCGLCGFGMILLLPLTLFLWVGIRFQARRPRK